MHMYYRSKHKSSEKERIRKCCVDNCLEYGEYPAPKFHHFPGSLKNSTADDAPQKRDWYCLDHIRKFNRNWDFFSGMSIQEIEKFQIDALTGHRQVFRIEPRAKHWGQDKLNEAYEAAWKFRMGREYIRKEKNIPDNEAPKNERDAMLLLGLSYPLNKKDLKKRYYDLVKRFHPDKNGGKTGEEKLKVINQAYSLLNGTL